MDIPIISKRRAAARSKVEGAAIAKTLAAVGSSLAEVGEGELAKSFLTGNAARSPGPGVSAGRAPGTQSKHPGTSWSGTGSASSQLIQRVTQNLSAGFGQAPEELELALAEQGLSWGPPFPPGRPLDPFFGVNRAPRTFDYSVGSNTQLTPRWNRVSFPTIKSVYEAYDVAQICVRHLINDVRSLDYNWEPIPGIKADVADDIEQAIAFFDSPDKRQPFRTWLAEWLQDVLRYDAGSLYIRRNEGGDPIALEIVSGPTIIPLVDFYGRRPEDEDDENATPAEAFGGEIVPAYVQIVEGLPWVCVAADDLLYQPWNPLPDSQYGLAPLEAVLLSANTDIRFQWHFLQFFTEGTMPAGFMEAPPEMSDPAQIAQWQETWDAVMQGDQTKIRQVRWVPSGSKFTEAKPTASKFDSEFPLYLMRRTCASFGVTPNDLGFTENVNRATGDTQVDVQFRVGTSPLLRYVEDVINLFTKQHLKLRCRLRFDDGKETEDRVATATADGIYIDHGVKGVDETRQELGLPVDKSRPISRFVNNSRVGPIPLIALESMAGTIDAETYGPADSQTLVDTPYVAAPGVIPPAGTPEQKASAEATGNQANALRAATSNTDPHPESEAEEAGNAGAEESPIAKMLKLLDEIEKAPSTGLTVATGVAGVDLDGDDDEEEEPDAIKAAVVALSLRRWRTNSRNRLKKGLLPKRFVDPTLPDSVHTVVWAKLQRARSREEVDRAFKSVGKAKAGKRPAFHSQADAITEHYGPLIAAGLGKLFTAAQIKKAIKAAEAVRAAKHVVKAAEPDPAAAAAMSALEAAGSNPTELRKLLDALYGDSYLQGAHDAAHAAGGSVVASLQDVTSKVDASYWDAWKPGNGPAAAAAADGGMKDLLDQADLTIQGMTDTSIERIGNSIADGLTKGDSFETTAKAVQDVVEDPARADTIANTEYARAMTTASEQTYAESGIEEEIWEAEGDACVECEENAASSPSKVGEEWPNGSVPVHPNCRCSQAPVGEASEPPADESETPGALVLAGAEDTSVAVESSDAEVTNDPTKPDLSYRGEHTAPGIGEGTKLDEMSADEQAVYGVDDEGKVSIYRSTPANTINQGDWVSTSKEAINRAAGSAPTTEARVPARDLVRRKGDEEDAFGYVGPHLLPVPPHKPQGKL